MNVILPDGRSLSVPDGATAMGVAEAISPRLARAALACKVNGAIRDLSFALSDGDSVSILTFDDPEGKTVFWHSSSHILAQAVQELFPAAKVAIGPAIEGGFYYDFDTEKPFTPEDIAAIEKKFKEIAEADTPFKRIDCDENAAKKTLRG